MSFTHPAPPSSDEGRLRAVFRHWVQLAQNPGAAFFAALSFGAFVAVWFSGGDMFIVVPALAVGWILAAIGWSRVPGISRSAKLGWVVAAAIMFTAEGIGIYCHFHPEIAAESPPNLVPSSENTEYIVTFKGTCKYKLINPSFLPCDSVVTFINFKNHKGEFTFTVEHDGAFIFFGDADRQPNLENYFLSVDWAALGLMSDTDKGAQGRVEGECHMRLNKDASKFYEIKCDVFDRNSGLQFNFYLTDISSFEKKDFR